MRHRLASAIGFPAYLAPEPAIARRVNRRSLLWALLAIAAVTVAAVDGSMSGTSTHPRRVVGPSPHSQAHLSTAASLAISRGLGANLATYRLARSSGGFVARNARQGLTASFSARGATVNTRDGAHASIALRAIGSGVVPHPAGPASPLARGNRVEYRRGAATEWFANGPAGIEQGFTIASKPAGVTDGMLTLALGLSGTLTARPGTGGGLLLSGAGGSARLSYSDLSVSDASGRRLPAHMIASRGQITIAIDTHGARYPLTVDPILAQIGELYASDGVKESELGNAVAVSGSTVVVGDSAAVKGGVIEGAAYVFTEGAGGWATATQVTKLMSAKPDKEEGFGTSVAVSGDTIVVGAPGREEGLKNFGAGAAFVFSEPAGGWGAAKEDTQAVELLNSEDVFAYQFGQSVAISGETIVVGSPQYRDYTQNLTTPAADGAAFVFVRPAAGWSGATSPTYQTATLDIHETEGEEHITHVGEGVAIAEQGSTQTIVVGAPGAQVGTEFDKYRRGTVFLYDRPAEGWINAPDKHFFSSGKLTASNANEFAELGESVSASGGVIAAGARYAEVEGTQRGAAYVFAAPAEGWGAVHEQTQAAELTNPVATEPGEFGKSVAVEGSTVAVAGRAQNVFLFSMPSAGWSGEQRQSAEFTAGPKPGETGIGSVALGGGEVFVGRISASPPAEKGNQFQGAVDVVPYAPLVVTDGTSGLTEVAATVEGAVSPDQTTLKECHFQYGTSSSYGQEVPCSSFPSTGVVSSPVSAALTGLAPGTTYHYRVIATNEVDTSYGADATFTTSTGKGGETPPNEKSPEEKSPGGSSTVTGSTTPITTTTPTPSTGVSVSVASTPKAIKELLNGCSGSPLVLNDVYIQGSRVEIRGSAAKSYVGKRVKILFNEGKSVATATVEANGQYTTTAPLPPAKIRDNLDTRYTAEIGKLRSLHLKLVRRLLLEPPKAAGTTITLTGEVAPPLTKPIAPVTVEQQLECGKTTVVKTFTPSASGRFDITVTVPPNARAAIFRLTSKVAANKHSVTHGFTTFSLPLPIAIG